MRARSPKRGETETAPQKTEPILRTVESVATELSCHALELRKLLESTLGCRRWLTTWEKRFETSLTHSACETALPSTEAIDPNFFADVLAQSIMYALFVTRLQNDGERLEKQSLLDLAITNMPSPLPELLGEIRERTAPKGLRELIDRMIDTLNSVDPRKLEAELGLRSGYENPLLHFYEAFLAAYDPALRKTRGVYYTPQPIVDYLVDSVDFILRETFALERGLTHPTTAIVDLATGTGAFPLGALEKASGEAKAAIARKILGFDVMPTACLATRINTGSDSSEATILLTRSLEESARASIARLKSFDSIVVLGNPPYSGESANHDQWMHDLLRGYDSISDLETESYFSSQGEPLKEKNIKWLNDDYVKFIRFAQWQVEQKGSGIIAFVTNNGYLDNPTFRGMRESLLKTFDEIYILDLHGNANKGERNSGKGHSDENVFDIKQGVAIGIFVKTRRENDASRTRLATVHRADLYGTREEKLAFLKGSSVSTTKWGAVDAQAPEYLFTARDASERAVRSEYFAAPALPEIFKVNNVGIVTARDSLAIQYTRSELKSTLTRFSSLPPERARKEFDLGPDARDWKVTLAQEDLRLTGLDPKRMVPLLYRPFDLRYTYFTGRSRGIHCMPRGETMKHMIKRGNIALIATKQTKDEWRIGVTATIMGHKSIAAYDINSLFPLYLFDENGSRASNLSESYLTKIEVATGIRHSDSRRTSARMGSFSSVDAFHYIVALVSAPSYKKRYSSFLKRAFARVPLPTDAGLFWDLVALGRAISEVYLMNVKAEAAFPAQGSNIISKPRFSNGRIWINERQYFADVDLAIWETRIGGYLPAQRWLKDRRGRRLTADDINHFQKLLASLRHLSDLEREIDTTLANHGFWDRFRASQPKAA